MIIGSVDKPFVLLKTSGSTSLPTYICHDRSYDEIVMSRGIECLSGRISQNDLVLNCLTPGNLNGAYYFIETVCRQIGCSYAGVGPACFEDVALISQDFTNYWIVSTGSQIRNYLDNQSLKNPPKGFLFIGESPDYSVEKACLGQGSRVEPVAYSTMEFGPIAKFVNKSQDQYAYKLLSDLNYQLLPFKPEKEQFEIQVWDTQLNCWHKPGDVVQIIEKTDSDLLFALIGRLESQVNFFGVQINQESMEKAIGREYFYQVCYSLNISEPKLVFTLRCPNAMSGELREAVEQHFSLNMLKDQVLGLGLSIETSEKPEFILKRGKTPNFIKL